MDRSDSDDKPRAIRRPGRRARPIVPTLARFWHDRRAATAVEYGFVVALVVIAMVAALAQVGNVTSSMWNNVNAKVTNAH